MSFATREQVLALIEEHAPERLRQVLADNLRPAVGIVAREAKDTRLEIGASKIGGAPDVPRGFEWPMWNGKPLGFVAQFNLEEVAAFDLEHVLPPSGTLSFFYAIEEQPWGSEEDEGSWRVLWWPREEDLGRRVPPAQADISSSLPPYALDLGIEWRLKTFVPDFLNNTSDEERQSISHVLRVLAEERRGAPLHRLLGESDPIQNPVELDLHETFEAEEMDEDEDPAQYYERLLSGGLRWRLLLQLDSQKNSEGKWQWMWGDAGMIYFCIRADELAARRFDKVWLQLQCS